MAFVPRTFEEIRDDMIAFVQMQTDLTDFEIGSVIRTIIEAAALEDDEQYFQMVQLLDAFRLSTAAGRDLDDRVEEFGIIRLQSAASAGEIVITDLNLIINQLAFDSASGSATIILDDSTGFPGSGTVRIGEGTVQVEDIAFTANDTGTGTLTLTGTTVNAHSIGNRVSIVTAASDVPLSIGIRAQVPATGDQPSIVVVTSETGTQVNGNFNSTPIRARAENPGTEGNVTANTITEFVTNPPFDGAAVNNLTNFAGGRNLETDAQLRDRARRQIQSLSRGTLLALQQGVIGTEDTVTGQRVTTSNILESFVLDEVTVFVDDGTGFTADTVELARSSLDGAVGGGSGTLVVVDSSDFPAEGFIIVSPENAAQTEILEYSAVDFGTHTFTLVGTTAASITHDDTDEVALVDIIESSAEAGQNFFRTQDFPVVRGSQRIWIQTSGTPPPVALQTEDTNYFLNRGTGDIEFIGPGLPSGTLVAGHYDFYTALIKSVQTVVDGDPNDPVNFPGLRAAGVQVVVETPTIRRITVRVSITAEPGNQETDLAPQVQEAIEAYINSLGIGSDVIRAEIITRAMNVDGVENVIVTLPTEDLIILEDELPRPVDANGDTLVTVN